MRGLKRNLSSEEGKLMKVVLSTYNITYKTLLYFLNKISAFV
jgi:hypothetical protein